jgi:hypothetical protein
METEKKDYRTSINCMNSTRVKLRNIAVHPRETDEDIILRLIKTTEFVESLPSNKQNSSPTKKEASKK